MTSLKTVNQQSWELFLFNMCMQILFFPHKTCIWSERYRNFGRIELEVTYTGFRIPAGRLKSNRLHLFHLESQI